MSLIITEVHYNPDPKHIIITSQNTPVDCAQPVAADKWLDGIYGEVICVYSNQYMHFEKALCDGVPLDDVIFFLKFTTTLCLACGILNAPMCCLNTTPANSYVVKDGASNCLGEPQPTPPPFFDNPLSLPYRRA